MTAEPAGNARERAVDAVVLAAIAWAYYVRNISLASGSELARLDARLVESVEALRSLPPPPAPSAAIPEPAARDARIGREGLTALRDACDAAIGAMEDAE